MGLFSKKNCDICEGEIGLLGNTKLQDGNLCKNCKKKLSPYFKGAGKSTVAQIAEQLKYREANQTAVMSFHTTRTVGTGSTKLYVDEDARKFIVSNTSSFKNGSNPDVIDLSAVTGADINVDERRTEEKTRDKDGKMVSYVPPHYKYHYTLDLYIYVNHPYFSEIKIPLGETTIEGWRTGGVTRPGTSTVHRQTSGSHHPSPASHHGQGSANSGAAIAGALVKAVATAAFSEMKPDPFTNGAFANMHSQGEEMKRILMGGRDAARKEEAANPSPKMVTCEYCGATVEAGSGTCEYCGAPIG